MIKILQEGFINIFFNKFIHFGYLNYNITLLIIMLYYSLSWFIFNIIRLNNKFLSNEEKKTLIIKKTILNINLTFLSFIYFYTILGLFFVSIRLLVVGLPQPIQIKDLKIKIGIVELPGGFTTFIPIFFVIILIIVITLVILMLVSYRIINKNREAYFQYSQYTEKKKMFQECIKILNLFFFTFLDTYFPLKNNFIIIQSYLANFSLKIHKNTPEIISVLSRLKYVPCNKTYMVKILIYICSHIPIKNSLITINSYLLIIQTLQLYYFTLFLFFHGDLRAIIKLAPFSFSVWIILQLKHYLWNYYIETHTKLKNSYTIKFNQRYIGLQNNAYFDLDITEFLEHTESFINEQFFHIYIFTKKKDALNNYTDIDLYMSILVSNYINITCNFLIRNFYTLLLCNLSLRLLLWILGAIVFIWNFCGVIIAMSIIGFSIIFLLLCYIFMFQKRSS
jgi:hypothetical protein